jgi:hypothetical protein
VNLRGDFNVENVTHFEDTLQVNKDQMEVDGVSEGWCLLLELSAETGALTWD